MYYGMFIYLRDEKFHAYVEYSRTKSPKRILMSQSLGLNVWRRSFHMLYCANARAIN
jgi:hypothetical protein